MPVNTVIREQLDKVRDDIHEHMDTLGQVTEEQQQHELDTENPHADTPASVGLGDLANYPVATPEEAAQGESSERYLTPSLADDVWGDHAIEPTINTQIRRPGIISPVQNAVDVDRSPTIAVDGYASNPVTGFPMASREYQIDAAGNDFSNPIWTHTASDQSPVTVDITLSYHALLVCRVRDIDTEGNVSDWSVSRMFRTVAYETVPANITSPADGGSAAIGDSVLWTAYGASDFEGFYILDHYAIEIADDSGFTNVLLSDTTAAPSYEIGSDLPREVPIWVRVRPVWVEDATTAWSSAVEMTIDAYELQPINIVSPAEGSTILLGTDVIQWEDYTVADPDDVYSLERYELMIATDAAFTQNVETLDCGTATGGTITAYPHNGTVFVRVRAVTSEGHLAVSPWSAAMSYALSDVASFATVTSSMGGTFHSVAVASDGSVYAAGYQQSQPVPSGGGQEAYLTKWSPTGQLLWQRSVGGSSVDQFHGVTVASDGSVYAAGSQQSQPVPGGGSAEALITKWSPTGQLLWQRSVGGSDSDAFYDVTVSSDGYVYAAGHQYSQTVPGGGSAEAYLTKWSPTGGLLWQRSVGGMSHDSFQSVTVASDGSVYATGYQSSQTVPGGTGYEAYLTKWSPTGQLLWQRSVGGSSNDLFYGVTVSSDGHVYAAGRQQSQTVPGGGSAEAYLTKWSPTGQLLWQRSVGGSGHDYFQSVTVATDGSVYAAGYQQSQTVPGGGSAEAYLTKWSPTGQLLWQRSVGGSGHDYFYGVTVSSDGHVYAAGQQGGGGLLVSLVGGEPPADGPLPDLTGVTWATSTLTVATNTLTAATSTLSVATNTFTTATPTLTADDTTSFNVLKSLF